MIDGKDRRRLMLLLAGSNFDRMALTRLLRQAAERPESFVDEVMEIREGLGLLPQRARPLDPFLAELDAIFAKTGWERRQWAWNLSEELARKHGPQIPHLTEKGSVPSWLKKVRSRISPSEILHEATKLRNERIHNPRPDWKLS